MACIGCEEYAKRVTNVYRDEELKEKFSNLTGGYEILSDCFICDNCNTRLQQALEFKHSCIVKYKKNNPNALKRRPIDAFHSTTIEGSKEYFIMEANDEVLMHDDDDTMSQSQFVHIDQTASVEDGQEYSIYELEETPKMSSAPKNSKKPPSRANVKRQPPAAVKKQSIVQQDEEPPESSFEDNAKAGRKSYSLQQKLEIIEFSERHSNREASRHFSLNESTVRCFRRQKDSLLKMSPTKSTNRRGTPYWPDLELRLKEWTQQQKKKPKINDIRDQAIQIANQLGHDTFNGSTSWTFKFMQRHNINSSQPRPRKHTLKSETDD